MTGPDAEVGGGEQGRAKALWPGGVWPHREPKEAGAAAAEGAEESPARGREVEAGTLLHGLPLPGLGMTLKSVCLVWLGPLFLAEPPLPQLFVVPRGGRTRLPPGLCGPPGGGAAPLSVADPRAHPWLSSSGALVPSGPRKARPPPRTVTPCGCFVPR